MFKCTTGVYTLVKLTLSLVLVSVLSCSKDDGYIGLTPEPVSPVVFNIDSIPYNNLSEYNFFEGNISDLNPVYGVLPYDLNSALFSDYASKKDLFGCLRTPQQPM
ncbi:MAG: hypothetical protein ACI93P_002646 [bacterium]